MQVYVSINLVMVDKVINSVILDAEPSVNMIFEKTLVCSGISL